MARLKTRSEIQEERRKKRTQRITLVVTLFMLVILVFSTVGFYFTGNSSSIRYHGHTIRQIVDDQGGIRGYVTKVDGQQVFFYTQPEDSLGIAAPPGFVDALRQASILVFLFDPTDNQTALFDQLRFDLRSSLPVEQVAGVTQNASDYDLPVLSCDQATPQYPILLLRSGNRSITAEGGCCVLSGSAADITLLRDRIVYAYYGITT